MQAPQRELSIPELGYIKLAYFLAKKVAKKLGLRPKSGGSRAPVGAPSPLRPPFTPSHVAWGECSRGVNA